MSVLNLPSNEFGLVDGVRPPINFSSVLINLGLITMYEQGSKFPGLGGELPPLSPGERPEPPPFRSLINFSSVLINLRLITMNE